MEQISYHSVCCWTFNSGKGGFVPSDVRPSWGGPHFGTVQKIQLVRDRIAPRLPENVRLGLEAHYAGEYNEETAAEIADALLDADMSLAMATPGAHGRWAYGGICSLDPNERREAGVFGQRAVELVYGPLKRAWHPEVLPTFVVWNGSFGYDLATVGIQDMYRNLKEGIVSLCRTEAKLGGLLHIGIEPKPNEGHPAMLLPTVASAIVFWHRLAAEYGISLNKKGVNKEFGHSEMIGLDLVYDTVEEIDNNMLVHMHVNSQGYNDGILMGGPGKYDIDNGARINGMNIAVAGLMQRSGYGRWKGHDMQPRAYDSEEQAIDRVIRSILSWEACEKAARNLDESALMALLVNRETAKAEDMMRAAVSDAQNAFNEMSNNACLASAGVKL